jgi:hypothetical protein
MHHVQRTAPLLQAAHSPALLDVHDTFLFPQHARRHFYTLTAQLTITNKPEEAPGGDCCVDLCSPLRRPEQRPATWNVQHETCESASGVRAQLRLSAERRGGHAAG